MDLRVTKSAHPMFQFDGWKDNPAVIRPPIHYRPDVDGLRAVAVLLVIGFHAFPDLIPGGYVGVDVFFVISGFLITGLLLDDLKRKKFSVRTFYARRIRRIFPALIVVLVATFAVGWILFLPRQFESLGLNIFGGAAFSSNLVLLRETGYFDVSAAQKPLLHLWSLGVEEQFYIVWPILLLLAFSRRLSILLLAAALFIASFAWNIASAGTPADFYLPVTRAWELMIGGAIAAAANRIDEGDLNTAWQSVNRAVVRRIPAPIAAVLSYRELYPLIGLALIVLAVVGLKKNSSFPGWWALLPTIGAALIIVADGARFNRLVLASPVVVLIGLISYPLYLWHWPLLSFAAAAEPAGLSIQLRLLAIVAALALAWLTYRWIELPIRTGQPRPLKIAGLCMGMTVAGIAGLSAFHWQGFSFRLPEAIRDIANVKVDAATLAAWRRSNCLLETNETKFAPDCLERGHRPLLFLWGDSHAAAFYPGIKELQRSVNFGIAQYTTAGCPPLLEFAVAGRPHCAEDNALAFNMLAESKPNIVLLYSAWDYGDVLPKLADVVAKLRALQVPRIVIMGPPPEWDSGGLPKAAYDYYMNDPLHRMIPMHSNFRVSQSWYGYEQQFKNQALALGTEYISTWDALCKGDECLTRLGNRAEDLIAFDYAHLTIRGSIYLADAIARCLFPGETRLPTVSDSANAPPVCHRPDK